MSIVCPQCKFENEDGASFCALCGSPLPFASSVTPTASMSKVLAAEVQEIMRPQAGTDTPSNPVPATTAPSTSTGGSGKRYFVYCSTSNSKTYVSGPDISEYFCNGCQEEHQIDDCIWQVEEEQSEPETTATVAQTAIQPQPELRTGDFSAGTNIPTTAQSFQLHPEKGAPHLFLLEMNTQQKIDISPEDGGILGRYGTVGAEIINSLPNGRMVSGEHCKFTFDSYSGNWFVEHLSHTNDTIYDGQKLTHGRKFVLRKGKLLVLANAITFQIIIV